MIKRFITSDFLERWSALDVRLLVSFIVAFCWMLVSAFLDIATPVSTSVWVSLWIAAPIVALVFPSIRILHPVNRIYDKFAKRAVQEYYELSSAERKLFPENYVRLLSDTKLPGNAKNALIREGDVLQRNILGTRELTYSSKVDAAVATMREINENLETDRRIRAEVTRELG